MSKPLTNDVFKTVFDKQTTELLEKMDDSMDRLDQKMKDVEEHFASSAREILARREAFEHRIMAAVKREQAWQARYVGFMLLTAIALAGGLWRAGLL